MRNQFKYTLLSLLTWVAVSSCNDGFMERYPLDRITDQNYWLSESDLQVYVNSFYPTYIVGFGSSWADGTVQPRGHNVAATAYGDVMSDNGAPNSYSTYLADQYVAYLSSSSSSLGYSFSDIRSLNLFIQNYNRANVSQAVKDKYLGEVLFFKAWDYFDKVRIWGEVPWLSAPLQTNSEELYFPKTERAALLDSIVSTVDKAIQYLPSKGSESNNRINKEMAVFLKMRIGLFEGTFRKYHKLNLDANRFLTYAAQSAQQLMEGAKYSLVQGDKSSVYYALFATESYASNPEAILWRQYSADLTYGAAFSRYFSQNLRHQFGATRSLVDEYLCSDGLPIGSSPLFKGKNNLSTEFQNRDPRLTQTIADFGTYNLASTVTQGANNQPYPNLPGTTGNKCPTGYRLAKWWYNSPTDWDRTTNGQQAGLMWRYAEVLLTYAEAKYELGEISQDVLDRSINLLRRRVGMPDLVVGAVPEDARLDGIYATYVGYSIAPVLREIRRERRVEMAFENTRWDDIVRWKAGKLLEVPVEGYKFNAADYPSASALSKLRVGQDIFLSDEGYIRPYAQTLPNGRTWNDKMYLFPFALQELILNKSLVQNPGWDSPN